MPRINKLKRSPEGVAEAALRTSVMKEPSLLRNGKVSPAGVKSAKRAEPKNRGGPNN